MLISSRDVLPDTPKIIFHLSSHGQLTHTVNHHTANSNLNSNFCCNCSVHLVGLPTSQLSQKLQKLKFVEKEDAPGNEGEMEEKVVG